MITLIESDPELEFIGTTPIGLMKYNYKGKLFTGMIEYWAPSGFKSGEEEYLEGIPEGLYRLFYKNGKLKQESYTYYGKLDKHFKMWDEDGNLIAHAIWDKGIMIEKIK